MSESAESKFSDTELLKKVLSCFCEGSRGHLYYSYIESHSLQDALGKEVHEALKAKLWHD